MKHDNIHLRWRRLVTDHFRHATKQLLLLLAPLVDSGRRPAAVVPFYHPDESAGINLRKRFPSARARNSPCTPLAVRCRGVFRCGLTAMN